MHWAAMTTPSKQYNTYNREARILGGDKEAGVEVMGGLERPNGMRKKSKEHGKSVWLRGITSGEERLDEVGGVGVEVIWLATDSLSLDAKEKGVEHLVNEGWQVEKLRYCWM